MTEDEHLSQVVCVLIDFREEAVHVLGFEVSEEELRDGLTGSPVQR